MKTGILSLTLIAAFLLAGCAPATPANPTPTLLVPALPVTDPTATPSPSPLGTFAPLPNLTTTPFPSAAPSLCTDPAAAARVESLKTSMLNADGALLSSLVSPTRGMEVRWVRYGAAVTYTSEQAKFLYETTFEVNWGDAPGSGLAKVGAFHDVIVPDLVKIFNQPYTLHCNELKHGGATYDVTLPFDGDFYSIYFAGAEVNGFLDWHTWVVGMDYENGKPYIHSLIQFYWEP